MPMVKQAFPAHHTAAWVPVRRSNPQPHGLAGHAGLRHRTETLNNFRSRRGALTASTFHAKEKNTMQTIQTLLRRVAALSWWCALTQHRLQCPAAAPCHLTSRWPRRSRTAPTVHCFGRERGEIGDRRCFIQGGQDSQPLLQTARPKVLTPSRANILQQNWRAPVLDIPRITDESSPGGTGRLFPPVNVVPFRLSLSPHDLTSSLNGR